jgi:hypothetical protein
MPLNSSPDSPTIGRSITDFCGQYVIYVAAPPQPLVFWSGRFLAIIELRSPGRVATLATEGAVMPFAKTITTLASVAALACGLFAFSWVSLALLGF